jgi:hypothetical protein
VCVCVCVHTHIYIYIHTHTHIFRHEDTHTVHSFIYSVFCLKTGPYSLLQSEFSAEWNPLLPLNLQYPLLLSFFVQVIHYLLTSFSSCFRQSYSSFYLSFGKLIWKAVLAQDLINPVSVPLFMVCRVIPSLPDSYAVLHFSHDLCNRFSLSFSSTEFQNFRDISYLISEVSQFQHHAKLCSICSTVLPPCTRNDVHKHDMLPHRFNEVFYWLF